MNTSRSAMDPLDDFLSHAVLRYDGDDGPGRWQRAREILTEHPELPQQSIFAAATVGDPELITRHLAVDPEAADRPGGPMAWTPLMYLAYSRAGLDRPAVDAERSVMILLQHGADPNAGYLSQGEVPPFTVLTGLFGNGEQGSVNDPAHPHAIRLATVQLDTGADPNDGAHEEFGHPATSRCGVIGDDDRTPKPRRHSAAPTTAAPRLRSATLP